MSFRERLLEDFAGDLEYHPRRGTVYLGIALAMLAAWILTPSAMKWAAVPLVFALGGLTLLLKGLYLFRKSSEGLGLTVEDIARLSERSHRKALPPARDLAAQLVQDFGIGAFLLGSALHGLNHVNPSWEVPSLPVALIGATLVAIGWFSRRSTSIDV